VNLAAGRSDYYQHPREIIDPESLEMGYYKGDPTLSSEARRYASNLGAVGAAYLSMVRLPGLIVLAASAVGVAALVRLGQGRFLLGLLAQVVYEDGATFGYYAGQVRGRVTPNDLPTLRRYVDRHHGGPVYLVLTTSSRYHPSLEALLHERPASPEHLMTVEDHRGRVVVYRL